MHPRDVPYEFHDKVDDTQRIWNVNAEWWDDRIGGGNDFQDLLVEPSSDRLLDLKPGETVLDIACGAGRFTRRMASKGVRIVAFDQSEAFLKRARERTTENRDAIEYRQLNASDVTGMLKLGEARFDAAVCTMAIMDMAVITPLFTTLPRLLKRDGRFVFTVMHPAFNSTCSKFLAQEQVRDGRYSNAFGVWVTDYITPVSARGEGIVGQPEPQWYFHRPISTLFNECFRVGFVLDGIEEPVLPAGGQGSMPLSWSNCPGVPPLLAARMRLR